MRFESIGPSLFVALAAAGGRASAQVWFSGQSGTQANGAFGYAMANVGDVDGDGIDDLLIGAPWYDTTSGGDFGRASLYSGATMSWLRDHDGNAAGQLFGARVARAGDVDGDGVPDYAVAAPFDPASTGSVVVYSGATGSIVWSVAGPATVQQFGRAMTGIGDVDGDGRSEVLVASWGAVDVYDASGGVLYSIPGSVSDDFGEAVAAIGDVDGDGTVDFVVAAPLEDDDSGAASVPETGALHAYSGATGAELHVTYGSLSHDLLGLSLSAIDDVDGDGIADFVSGGAGEHASTNDGMLVVASGATGAEIRTQRGAPQVGFGWSVAGLGDMNHDGVPDYVVGEIYGGAAQAGRAIVFSGADGTQLYEFPGYAGAIETNHLVGWSVAGGDWNGDGIADIAISDPSWSHRKSSLYPWITLGTVTEFLGCPAWSENYGAGWPGQNGVPALVALNDPAVGATLTIQIDDSASTNTAGLLLLGFSQTNLPTGKGGTILVSPSMLVPLAIPSGGLQLAGALPNDPALYFFDFDLQVLELDAAASKGMSFTPGLQLRLGFDL